MTWKTDMTHRTGYLTLAAASLAAVLALAPVAGRADVGDDFNAAGQSIKKGAQDTGAAIEQGAKDTGQTIKQHTEPVANDVKQGATEAGHKIDEGAHETGNFFERSTRDFRNGASNFFHKVGNFFSGNSSSN
jgi:hypothetical protein